MIKRFIANFKNTDFQPALFFVIALATYLRMHRLDYQSLWLDELYTMRETDPAISWKDSIDLVMQFENKSPLYFLLVKLVCTLFGHSGYVARFLSVVAGVISVYGMYLLGRELLSKRAGLVAALLTSVNYFHIYYSQEARGYMFLFLFSTLSFVYFLRFLKSPAIRPATLFGLYALLAFHFHPFGILVFMSQGLLALIFFFRQPRAGKPAYLKYFGLGLGIFILGFLPMLPALVSSSEISSSWIQAPAPDFFVSYISNFFYDSQLIKPFFYASLIAFLIHCFRSQPDNHYGGHGPGFAFAVLSSWLFIVFMVPYARSVMVIPVLVPRYMIVALPAVILLLAVGQASLKSALARYALTSCFVAVSLMELFVFQNYYFRVSKSQFRDLTELIRSEGNDTCLIINEKTGWQQEYYIRYMGLKNPLRSFSKELLVDSILRSSVDHKALKGFWLVGAHGDPKLSREKQRALDSLFYPAQSKDFNDAWGTLYLPLEMKGKFYKKISGAGFDMNAGLNGADSVLALYSNAQAGSTKALSLKAGRYKVGYIAKGTACQSIFPLLELSAGERSLGGSNYVGATYANSPLFDLALLHDTTIVFKVRMINDTMNTVTGEDRNAFIKSFIVVGR